MVGINYQNLFINGTYASRRKADHEERKFARGRFNVDDGHDGKFRNRYYYLRAVLGFWWGRGVPFRFFLIKKNNKNSNARSFNSMAHLEEEGEGSPGDCS